MALAANRSAGCMKRRGDGKIGVFTLTAMLSNRLGRTSRDSSTHEFQHHDGQDDGDDAIAEGFEAVFAHALTPL